jgi:hypothetical protein
MGNEASSDSAEARTFAVGEKVWVHDVRFPHSLRRARVVRVDMPPDGTASISYTVETGLGGYVRAETAQMHYLSDEPPVANCSHCAANPNAASSPRG